MKRSTLPWLGIGLCVPCVLLLQSLHNSIGIPTLMLTGLHWSKIERSDWIAHRTTLSYQGKIHIANLEVLDFGDTPSAENIDYNNGTFSLLSSYIDEVAVDNINVHWQDDVYETELSGLVYPTVQLNNDWMALERSTEESEESEKSKDSWTITGRIDSAHLPLNLHLPDATPEGLKSTFNFSMRLTDPQQPMVGTLQHITVQHPLLSRGLNIPDMTVQLTPNSTGWTGSVSNGETTVEGMWVRTPVTAQRERDVGDSLQWGINYQVALRDLMTWFGVSVPIASPTGHWVGTITPSDITISGRDLGFEGQINALHRLKTGQPIVYRPIHSEGTRLLGPNTPTWVPYPKLGWLARAVIAGEDAPFFTHNGFNEEGLNRALNELFRNTEAPIGGSSITQQVAKNLFTGNDVTLDRKVEEMVYTLGLEAMLNKEAILALYLNSIEFGEGIYGIQDACNKYFLKEPQYLSLKEAVFLASILPNPRDGYRRAKLGRPPTRRMRAILQNLVDGNQISSIVMKEAMREPLRLLLPVE